MVNESLKKTEWLKMLNDFKAIVNSGAKCIDSSDFSCSETCVQLDSVFEYSNFVENLFRSRLGKCNRYWIWDNKVSAFESMLNMTPEGTFELVSWNVRLEHRAWLAQSVERWTFNPTVAGSSPASG